MGVAFNHLGQCVTDLDRSRRFYVDVLGFEPWREINPPDSPSDALLRLEAPLGLTACYLRRDGLVLELLHFAGDAARPDPAVQRANRDRVMNEPGLTHISVSVDDIPATCARIVEHGGEVLSDTDIGGGIFVRDPDGQLIELLPMTYRDHVDATES
jgi:catechol 2,3-dioxygenase-like lactoylglutathione lyase family enzyme